MPNVTLAPLKAPNRIVDNHSNSTKIECACGECKRLYALKLLQSGYID